jgi:hypothetical protein
LRHRFTKNMALRHQFALPATTHSLYYNYNTKHFFFVLFYASSSLKFLCSSSCARRQRSVSKSSSADSTRRRILAISSAGFSSPASITSITRFLASWGALLGCSFGILGGVVPLTFSYCRSGCRCSLLCRR